jgi:DNA-binding MarR family transcriptional regulator
MQDMPKATLAKTGNDRTSRDEHALPVLPLDRAACACTIIRRAARQVTHVYDTALAPTGLRITQYSLLANLDRLGATAMTELAGLLSMDRTTLTRNAGPLERDGLISVLPTGRGRTKLVTLTDRGRRRLREAFPYWLQAQERLGHVLGAKHTAGLAEIAAAIRLC